MSEAATSTGFKFRIGKRTFRVWRNGMEVQIGSRGRVYFFPWHPLKRKRGS